MKKLLAALLLAALLAVLMLPMLAGCGNRWRKIPPSEYGETVVLGQLDRFEEDEDGTEWGVVSIGASPYSASFRANEEFNSEATKPGTWLTCALDGDYAYNIRLAVIM